jgi:hypothetical protein
VRQAPLTNIVALFSTIKVALLRGDLALLMQKDKNPVTSTVKVTHKCEVGPCRRHELGLTFLISS